MKKVLCAAAAILAIGTTAFIPAQAFAQVHVNVIIGQAPPPVRYEVAPAPRRGYEWAPGYWNWNGSRHIWSAGHWERVRAGQRYQRPEWKHDDNGWRLNRGGWHQVQHKRGHGKHDDRDRHDKGGRFCPPGHAKKGEC